MIIFLTFHVIFFEGVRYVSINICALILNVQITEKKANSLNYYILYYVKNSYIKGLDIRQCLSYPKNQGYKCKLVDIDNGNIHK